MSPFDQGTICQLRVASPLAPIVANPLIPRPQLALKNPFVLNPVSSNSIPLLSIEFIFNTLVPSIVPLTPI